jgi:aminoglycoside phosphotransferase
MREIPGIPAHEFDSDVEKSVIALADGLRRWHELPLDECPFDMRLQNRIDQARQNLNEGVVDVEDFDPIRIGKNPHDLFDQLLRDQPFEEDLVVVHGDYCLPNIILKEDAVSGYIDVALAGLGDRYQDLALIARSLTYNNKADISLVELFFDTYGASIDVEKIAFYQLLDEFF